jgi:hypothetical protein
MTTKIAGGAISYRIALTLEAQAALSIGDAVHITGNYECAKADGTKPIIGDVQKPNLGRGSTLGVGGNAGYYPVAQVPGDVSVGARGWAVTTRKSSAAIAAGVSCALLANGKVVIDGTANSAHYGVTLMAAGGADVDIDILVN